MKRIMKNRNGFTLIELLVVIAIIALLLSIIMPALKMAKRQAQAIVCLSNVGNLSKAWAMYSGENNDEIAGAETRTARSPYYSAILLPQDDAGNQKIYGCTVEEEKNGIKRGTIYPYLEMVEVYHCPGDTRSKYPPLDPGFSGEGGYRTYSMPGGLRGVYDSSTGKYEGWGIAAHTKTTTIKSPGNKYAFLEEMDGRGWNLGAWCIKPSNPDSWVDPVAIWHGDRSNFGFADGHGGKHKWTQDEVIKMCGEQRNYATIPGEDTDFMHRGYPYLRISP